MNRILAFTSLSLTLLGWASPAVWAAPTSVLAPVAETKGSTVASGGHSARTATIRTGDTLAESSVVKTGPDSRILFSPVPGTAVSGHMETVLSLVRMAVVKSGSAIESRATALGLEAGMLSFSIDQKTSKTTNFLVQTLRGTMSAKGSVGSVAIHGSCVHLASLSGKMTFMPNGSAGVISIPPGSYVTVCAEEREVRIHMVDVIAGTVTEYNADGGLLSSRAAEAADLESVRELFGVTLGHVVSAVGHSLLGSDSVAEVTGILTKVNQSLAAAGIPTVDAPAVGTSQTVTDAGTGSTTTPSGFLNGPANPANLSGLEVSREK